MAKKTPKKTYLLIDEDRRSNCIIEISDLEPGLKKPWLIEVSQQAEPRTNKQNRLSFLWYGIRGSILKTGKNHERRYCKLTFGVPIMRQHQEFNDFYMIAIDRLDYVSQLRAMDYIDVTSLMEVAEFAQYLNDIELDSVENDCPLPHPQDIYYESLMLEQSSKPWETVDD